MLNALRLRIHTAVRNPETKQRLMYVAVGTVGCSIIAFAVGYTGYVIPILGVIAAVIVIYKSKPPVEQRKRLPGSARPPFRSKVPEKPQPPRFFSVFVDVVEQDMRNVLKRFRKQEKPVITETPKMWQDDSWYWLE